MWKILDSFRYKKYNCRRSLRAFPENFDIRLPIITTNFQNQSSFKFSYKFMSRFGCKFTYIVHTNVSTEFFEHLHSPSCVKYISKFYFCAIVQMHSIKEAVELSVEIDPKKSVFLCILSFYDLYSVNHRKTHADSIILRKVTGLLILFTNNFLAF